MHNMKQNIMIKKKEEVGMHFPAGLGYCLDECITGFETTFSSMEELSATYRTHRYTYSFMHIHMDTNNDFSNF